MCVLERKPASFLSLSLAETFVSFLAQKKREREKNIIAFGVEARGVDREIAFLPFVEDFFFFFFSTHSFCFKKITFLFKENYNIFGDQFVFHVKEEVATGHIKLDIVTCAFFCKYPS